MWQVKGYIVHIGHYPDTAKYLIYDDYEQDIRWTSVSNDAWVFQTKDYCEFICDKFGIKEYSIRVVVITDMELK
jgi:hypothetical protein